MKTIKEIYYHIKGTKDAENLEMGSATSNYVKADVYYSEGGYSVFSGKMCTRGYFISAHKVGRGKDSCGYWESHAILAPDGGKRMLFEVNRQSKKREEEALAIFEKDIHEFVTQLYPDLELELEIA